MAYIFKHQSKTIEDDNCYARRRYITRGACCGDGDHTRSRMAWPQSVLDSWTASKSIADEELGGDAQMPFSEMVTSLTDKQALQGWHKEHAAREFWQNMRDGTRERFGRGIRATMLDRKRVRLADEAGRTVASVDFSVDNSLRIVQQLAVLLPQHLQLASCKANPDDAAGCHGEGFKVGIVLLLRKGFSVTYRMHKQVKSFTALVSFRHEG
jgi:hypothetical protein